LKAITQLNKQLSTTSCKEVAFQNGVLLSEPFLNKLQQRIYRCSGDSVTWRLQGEEVTVVYEDLKHLNTFIGNNAIFRSMEAATFLRDKNVPKGGNGLNFWTLHSRFILDEHVKGVYRGMGAGPEVFLEAMKKPAYVAALGVEGTTPVQLAYNRDITDLKNQLQNPDAILFPREDIVVSRSKQSTTFISKKDWFIKSNHAYTVVGKTKDGRYIFCVDPAQPNLVIKVPLDYNNVYTTFAYTL
jgi:hypothetical protein